MAIDPKLQEMFNHLADAHDSVVKALATRSDREVRCNPELLYLAEIQDKLDPYPARRGPVVHPPKPVVDDGRTPCGNRGGEQLCAAEDPLKCSTHWNFPDYH
jgi:hypothetical protein